MTQHIEHFDNIGDLYEKTRQGYPLDLYREVSILSKLHLNGRFLEIGAGSGIASQEIYNYFGKKMVLLEPAATFCEQLNRKFNNNKNIEIINSSFEDYQSRERFDIIFAASSFHWIQSMTKYKMLSNLLASEGLLVIYCNYYNIADESLLKEIAKINQEYGNIRVFDVQLQEQQISEQIQELNRTSYFKTLKSNRYVCNRIYDINNFRSLIRTSVKIVNHSDNYYNDIINVIKQRENQVVNIQITTSLLVARKAKQYPRAETCKNGSKYLENP